MTSFGCYLSQTSRSVTTAALPVFVTRRCVVDRRARWLWRSRDSVRRWTLVPVCRAGSRWSWISLGVATDRAPAAAAADDDDDDDRRRPTAAEDDASDRCIQQTAKTSRFHLNNYTKHKWSHETVTPQWSSMFTAGVTVDWRCGPLAILLYWQVRTCCWVMSCRPSIDR